MVSKQSSATCERSPGNSPEIEVLETLPEELGCDRLTVVHAALARVFAQHPVDDYLLFSAGRVRKQSDATESQATYLSLNQPFLPLNQLAVSHGPAGIRRNENAPITSVIRPCESPYQPLMVFTWRRWIRTSIKNSHLQPD